MRRLAVLGTLVTACSLAPKYERPPAPVATRWQSGTSGKVAADLGWRDVFADARLQALIELALHNNRDLRIAGLQVDLVRAQYRIERASLFPRLGAVAAVDARYPSLTADETTVTYTVGASLSYELDLFGRLRSLRDAALEAYLATASVQRAVQMAVVSEVATQYLISRALEDQLALAKQTLALVTESSEFTKRLAEQGQRSDLDLHTAEAQIEGARAEVLRVTRLRAQAENALVALVGVPVLVDLPAPAPLDTNQVVAELEAGVPSEVLLRRPDVVAAEHVLRGANANIGAARAAFFPSISLTAFGGLASTALSSLFTGGAAAWTAGADLVQPLFTGGRNAASLDVARVRKQIEVARYEQTIQAAFREVADALDARAALDEQLAAQTARVDAEQKRFAISEQRYRAGIESYLVVLTAQRDLFLAQQQLIETRLARLANLVALYRALGGGWR